MGRRKGGLSDLQFKILDLESIMYRKHSNALTVVDAQKSNLAEKNNYTFIYKQVIKEKSFNLLEKILAQLGIWRYNMPNNIIGKIIRKFLTLIAKIISNWYF
jgi:hypothetical protein